MNEMQVFQNSEFGEMGVLEIEDKFYFPATTCAKILGYSNPRKAVIDHCQEDGVTKRDIIDSLGRAQQMKYITEGNLYRLITHSKLPAAERFEKWVFDEVLPSIRRNGGYGKVDVTAIIMQTATVVCAEMVKQLVPILQSVMSTQPKPRTAPPIDYLAPAKCKLETFPAEITEQVDGMLADMLQQQALNFSMIARYCTLNGYTISSPAVKTYFQRHFSEA